MEVMPRPPVGRLGAAASHRSQLLLGYLSPSAGVKYVGTLPDYTAFTGRLLGYLSSSAGLEYADILDGFGAISKSRLLAGCRS